MENPPETPELILEKKKTGRSQSISILILSVFIMILAEIFFTQELNKIKAFISQAGA